MSVALLERLKRSCFIFRIYKYIIIFIFSCHASFLAAQDCPPGLLSIGGGYFGFGSDYCHGTLQAEYKWGERYWNYLRPIGTVALTERGALYVACGFGCELYLTERLIFTPSFAPGLYYNGNGKKLGHPVEFRSGLELAYQMKNKSRIGTQLYHISNAHLAHRNPGANALIFFIAFPQ